MPVCAVINCKTRLGKAEEYDGATYFRFPHPPNKLRNEWILFIRRCNKNKHWKPSECSYICSDHFQIEDTYIGDNGQLLLKKCAVPFEDVDEEQCRVIADIIKGILHSVDLLIQSDPDNIRSTNVKVKIIAALFPYQDIVDEEINLASYKQVYILDHLKEIDFIYNDIKDNDYCEDVNIIDNNIGHSIEDKIISNLRKKEANLVRNIKQTMAKRKMKSEKYKLIKKTKKEPTTLNKGVDLLDNINNLQDFDHSGDTYLYNDTKDDIENQTNPKKNETNVVTNGNDIKVERKVTNNKPAQELEEKSMISGKSEIVNVENEMDTFLADDNYIIFNNVDYSIEEFLSNIRNKEEMIVNKIKEREKNTVDDSSEMANVCDEMLSEDENDIFLVVTEDSKDNLGLISTVPRYVCDICDITLISEHHLNVHRNMCKLKYTYYGNSLLEEYWNDIKCPICDSLCVHRGNLRRHYVTHKVKDIVTALAPIREEKLDRENPEENMKLFNDFIAEFETEKNNDNIFTVKEPSIDDYVKLNLKKIVYDVDINKELYCSQCDILFDTKHELKEHKKKLNDTDVFVCNHCDTTFDAPSKLLSHTKIHKGLYDRESLYLSYKPEDTEGCPREIDYKLFVCKYCLVIFPQENSLQSHLTHFNKHGICYFKDPNNRFRKREIPGVKRKPDRRLQCNQCEKSFTIYHNLKEHLGSHSPTYLYYCDCGKGFKAKSRLKYHIKLVHARKFEVMCEVCGFKGSLGNLKRHKKIHSDVKPYQCSYCDQRFKQKQSLVTHIRTHTGEKPWQCQYCGIAFSEKRTYNIHINIHEGKTPYKCTQCPSAFVSKLKLNKHMIEHTDCRYFT